MPKSTIPAIAEGLSKFLRHSVPVGTVAICAMDALPEKCRSETSTEEFKRLFSQLSADLKRDFLEFMRHLSDPEKYPIWTGPAFYEVLAADKLLCCWIDRVWCEKERGYVYESRIYWDGYLLAPAERFRNGDITIVRKLTDLKLRKPKYNRPKT